MRPDELRDLEQVFPETAAAYTLDRAFQCRLPKAACTIAAWST